MEVKKQGEKAGSKLPVAVEKVTIDSSTKRLLATLKGGRKVLWVYARGNKRILSWPGGSIELDAADLTEGAGAGGGSLKPLKLTMPGKVLRREGESGRYSGARPGPRDRGSDENGKFAPGPIKEPW